MICFGCLLAFLRTRWKILGNIGEEKRKKRYKMAAITVMSCWDLRDADNCTSLVACDETKLPTQLRCKPRVGVVKSPATACAKSLPKLGHGSSLQPCIKQRQTTTNNDRIGIDKTCPPAGTTASRAARLAPSVPPGDGISKMAGGIVSKDIRLR